MKQKFFKSVVSLKFSLLIFLNARACLIGCVFQILKCPTENGTNNKNPIGLGFGISTDCTIKHFLVIVKKIVRTDIF